MKVIQSKKNIILSWANKMEEEAEKQLINAADHPCVDKPVVACPDVHTGFGVTIGCVLPVSAAVIPNAIGVDIGCSMSACRTNIKVEEMEKGTLERILYGDGDIEGLNTLIPRGHEHNKFPQSHGIFEDEGRWALCKVCRDEFESAKYQLGTMGGGNHFIELQEGNDGYLYYMIHSGSRNLGFKVGNYYNKLAKDLCYKWRQDKVVEDELPFFPSGTTEYNDYLREMYLCMDFAKANHECMQRVIEEVLSIHIEGIRFDKKWYTMHNYASVETYRGLNLVIHRKGAIKAEAKKEQIIPGSQGTASYIVEGLGNEKSYNSASHGSGRLLSRRKARESLSLKEERKKMEGILHNMDSVDKLDEAPSAYKNIENVLIEEADLVTPMIKLTPLAVLKG